MFSQFEVELGDGEMALTPIDIWSTDFPRNQHPVKELRNSNRIRPILTLPRSAGDCIVASKVTTAYELIEHHVVLESAGQLHLTQHVLIREL